MNEISAVHHPPLRPPTRPVDGLWGELSVCPAVARQIFVRRMQAGYRESFLGYLWLIVPPVATAGVWVALSRARVLQFGRTEIPYPLFVLSGMVLWQLFVDALNAPLRSLTASRRVLAKTRIPHEAVLLAGVYELFFGFAVRMAVLLPVLAWYRVAPSASLLLVPVGVFSLALLGFSAGLLLAPAGMLYADVSRGLTLVAALGFFVTPVVYPLPPTGSASAIVALNPVAPLLVSTRAWLAGGAPAPAGTFAAIACMAAAALALGWWSYRVARPHLVSRL